MSNQAIFVSYSRKDKAFVDRMMADLEQSNFSLWRDTHSLETGTPSWERAIREAIKDAGAVILVASPASLESDYVQGEITLSKVYNRPIYPIWADGDIWAECVPLDMANYQYVDGRNANYEASIQDLATNLSKLFDTSDGKITLGLPTHETVELNLAQFETGFNILSYVWTNYLQGWYEPFSYGREWIIGNVKTKQLAMPWQWLKVDATDEMAITQLNLLAGAVSYLEFGIRDGSYWAVWDARRLQLRTTAVFLNNDDLRAQVLSGNGASELFALSNAGVLKHQPLDEVFPSHYKYNIVMAAFAHEENNKVFVEA